jgi:hypothetical protein
VGAAWKLDFAQLEPIAKVISAFGLPFWFSVILWAFFQIRKLLSGAIEALRKRDDSLQKIVEDHIAHTDKRIALMEQLITRHDRNIETIWQRMDTTNGFREIPR